MSNRVAFVVGCALAVACDAASSAEPVAPEPAPAAQSPASTRVPAVADLRECMKKRPRTFCEEPCPPDMVTFAHQCTTVAEAAALTADRLMVAIDQTYGDDVEARRRFVELVATEAPGHPGLWREHLSLAKLLKAARDHDGALAQLDRALELAPAGAPEVEIREQRALVYWSTKRCKAARAEIEAMVACESCEVSDDFRRHLAQLSADDVDAARGDPDPE